MLVIFKSVALALVRQFLKLLARLLPELYSTWSNYYFHNFLDCDWFKKVLFSTNPLAKNSCQVVIGRMVWVIDQVWGQDGWILAKFFYCMFMDRDEVEVHNSQKKKRGQYPAILTEQTWSIKDLLHGFWGNIACGIQGVVLSGQDGSILPAWVANHRAWFGESCLLAGLAI